MLVVLETAVACLFLPPVAVALTVLAVAVIAVFSV